MNRTSRIYRILLRGVLSVVGAFIALILLFVLMLQVPQVQNYLTGKAVHYLEDRSGVEVQLDRVNISLPNSLVLQGLYVEDVNRDTLIGLDRLIANISLWKLLRNELKVKYLSLHGVTTRIHRSSLDSTFNFEPLLSAFSEKEERTPSQGERSGAGFNFLIGDIRISELDGSYRDEVNGINSSLVLGHLSIEADEVDWKKKRIHLEQIDLEAVDASWIQTKAFLEKDNSNDPGLPNLDIKVNTMHLAGIKALYADKPSGMQASLDLTNLKVYPEVFDLPEQRIYFDRIEMAKALVAYSQEAGQGSGQASKQPESQAKDSDGGWSFGAGELIIDQSELAYDDFRFPRKKTGLDPRHLKIQDLNFNGREIDYQPASIRATIQDLTLEEKSGLQVRELSGKLEVDSSKAQLAGLQIRTKASSLKADLYSSYRSIQELADHPGRTEVDVKIRESRIGMTDIHLFQPELRTTTPFMGDSDRNVLLVANVQGRIDSLLVKKLIARTGRNTSLKARGYVGNLPDINEVWFDMVIDSLVTMKRELLGFLPDSIIPEPVNLPEKMSLRGWAKGSMTDLSSEFDFSSNYGRVLGVIDFRLPKDSSAQYVLQVTPDNFHIGRLLNQEDAVGRISMKIGVEGDGLDWENVNAKLDGHIDSLRYRDYVYQNIDLTGTAEPERFNGNVSMRDTNLAFSLQTKVRTIQDTLRYLVNIQLGGADLHALNLLEDSIRASGHFRADFSGDKLTNLNGSASMRDVVLVKGQERYPVDSLLFLSMTREDKTDISLRSDFLDGYFRGRIELADLIDAIQRHINHYYKIISPEKIQPPIAGQNFKFDIDLKDPGILQDVIFPGIEEFSPGRISGSYDSRDYEFELDLYMPFIKYQNISFDSLRMKVNSDRDELSYSIQSVEVSNPALQAVQPEIYGAISDDKLYVALKVAGGDTLKTVGLAGQIQSLDSTYQFRFFKEGVVLNGEQWSVPDEHYLEFGLAGIRVENIRLSNGRSSLAIQSQSSQFNAPLEMSFTRFDLDEVVQALEARDSLLGGVVDGDIVLSGLGEKALFSGNLIVEDATLLQYPLGKLAILAEQKADDIVALDLDLTGSGNDVRIDGTYNLMPVKDNLDLSVDVRSWQLDGLETFFKYNLEEFTGTVNGRLQVDGSIETPELDGKLQFNQTAFRVRELGTRFHLTNEVVRIDDRGVHFDNFKILDSLGQEATISGGILTTDLRAFDFSLNVDATAFNLLDKPKAKGDIFYGKLRVTSNIRIRGDLNTPLVSASARILKGSDVTMALPPEDPSVISSGGIDEFIDIDAEIDPIMSIDEDTVEVRSAIRGLDLRATLNVDPEARLKIILEEGGGNYIKVRGEGDLVFGIDPGGKINLSGRYEVSDGEYQLVYRTVVRRRFDIRSGSYIIWSGDPLDAQVKLQADHTVETEALGLVQDQLQGDSREELNRFKQKLPFQVVLNMDGEIMEPDINFGLELPAGNRGALGGQVQSRLNQLNRPESRSELNKQVFSLLVLGRFLPGDPFAKQTNSAEAAARSSVSRILNTQLDKLSDRYIKGVDLDLSIDSYEDYSSGEAEGRTELNIGLQKALLDERLKIRVGGNIDLEGPGQRNQQPSDLIGDLSLEYILTEDGTWRLRGYRKNQYEGILDGEISKTGVSVIFRKDYNAFRNIFKKEDDVKPSDQ